MANVCNATEAVQFVHRFQSDCAAVATALQVPVENILGLAAEESQYGRGRIASEYNNFFSMHAPAPGQSSQVPAQGDKRVQVAVFSSFAASARSFATRYGPAVQGKTDPADFAKALVAAHYNSGNAATGGRSDFVSYLTGIISSVRQRIQCPTP